MTAKAMTLLLACALSVPALAQEHTPLFGKHKPKSAVQRVAPVKPAAAPAPRLRNCCFRMATGRGCWLSALIRAR